MKLDASALRYLTNEDFRILAALEIGSKNHEVVPLSMLASLARQRPGGVNGRLGELAKHGLVSKEHQSGYEGFRLTYGGYDYLALHALRMRGSVTGIGRQIGVGKEADVYLVMGGMPSNSQADTSSGSEASESEEEAAPRNLVLKIERLGRTSFRSVKINRDYVGGRKHTSWMYMSRLAAEKEWAFLKALHSHGFPTPRPIDWNRHCIVMEAISGRILEQVHTEDYPVDTDLQAVAVYLYGKLMRLLVRMAEHGLVHGDFNEFNLLLQDSFIEDPQAYLASEETNEGDDWSTSPIVMIDFPQMISTQHVNAGEQFERDVTCLRLFFARRYGFEAAEWPRLKDVLLNKVADGLDSRLKASGHRGTSNNHATEVDEPESESKTEDEASEQGSDRSTGIES